MKKTVFVWALIIALLFTACAGASGKDTEATQTPTQTVDDGVLKVLLIGNSFSYYFTDELYGMLKTAGKEAVIANVYYSGCSLYRHVNDYKNNIAEFEYDVTDGNGRTEAKNVGLAFCLDADDWDVISIQNHFYPKLTETFDSAMTACDPNAKDLIEIIRKHKPDAKIVWHETWAFQVGYERNDGKVTTVEDQTHQYEVIRDVTGKLTEKLGISVVPSGDAWQIARADPLIGDTLCTDTTRGDGKGDNYHDGNVGGGQYLNACVWFEALTGQSPVGSLFYPDYSLSREAMKALQTAAHQAFAEQ